MALNQFTTQSAWGTAYLNASTEVDISALGGYTTPALEMQSGSLYNMQYLRGALKLDPAIDGLHGIYLLNMSFTTSGAVNDQLSARFEYEYSDGGVVTYLYSEPVNYDSKGGNQWSVNQSVLMKLPNTRDGKFRPSFANLTDASNFTLTNFIISVIKIY